MSLMRPRQQSECKGSRRPGSTYHCTKGDLYRTAVCTVLVLASLTVPAFCDEEDARTASLADENAEPAGRRRAQGGFPQVPRDQSACAAFAEEGELGALCATAAGTRVCPDACASAAANAAPAPQLIGCDQMAARGALMCASVADICPDACANSTSGTGVPGAFTRADGAGLFQTNCIFLLKLEGGCAYELWREDPTLAPNTRVSTVCPNECSGHGQCVASAVDVALLGLTDDSSGHGGSVELQGSACVDGGGVTFDGGSWATITPGQDYGNEADFAITFWLLPAAADVWTPHRETGSDSRHLYNHPPTSQSSIAGGISVSVSRGVWLDAWVLQVSIAGTYTDFDLDLLRDATPKWTHLAIVVEPTQFRVYEDGEIMHDSGGGRDAVPRQYVGTMDLASQLFLGGSSASPPRNFQGTVAMLQLYSTALSDDDLRCVFDGGIELVRKSRMAQDTPSACRGRVSTGCTNHIASNFDESLPLDSIDDGSCVFDEHEAVVGEHAIVHVTDDWQRVGLTGSYTNPVVLCGVVTRDSTTQAVVRVRSVTTDPRTGSWYFEIAAEQKPCHFAQPPPTSEHVGFIVVEAGVSAEGWQAGTLRVHDTEWHRTSFLDEPEAGSQSVMISQVQTFDNRTQFVSTRHYVPVAGPMSSTGTVRAPYSTGVDQPLSDPPQLRQGSTNPCDGGAVIAGGHRLTYPADGNQYDSNLECIWLIQCPARHVPVVRFLALHTETDYDFVYLYDVELSGGVSSELNRWSGGETPTGHFAAAGPHMLLVFTSDSSRPEGGFSAECQCHPTAQTPRRLGFFLQVQGEGVWCQDGQFFAEYFDDLDLSGNPLATQCEAGVPYWHWHGSSDGVPLLLLGKTRVLAPRLFSARWTARMHVDETSEYVFSSYADQGSRIIVDGAIIVDKWSECCSMYTSDTTELGAGYHIIAYEYRSGYTADYSPANSYAELSWSVGGETFGAASGSNSTNVTRSTVDELYADVGWLVCSAGQGMLHRRRSEAGMVAGDVNLVTSIHFAAAFVDAPRMFGAIVSTADMSSHLRLSETAPDGAAVAIEYSTCGAVFASAEAMVGWIALAAVAGESVRVRQRQTLPTDTAALLAIGTALQLPEYFHWRNSSDPCGDQWTGIECRTDASGTTRIVVLDIHNVDLTNQDIPWRFVGQLTGLEEVSMYNCGLTGVIDESVCRLSSLQVLALRKNKLRGTVPECLAAVPLDWLWLEDNNFHGPLPELSVLGQFLKSVPSLSLHRNRWTPLLASEKQALEEMSGPLGVATKPHEGDWDFAYDYEWEWASGAVEHGLMAEREVSYRQWSAGVPFEGFYVELDFAFPIRGETMSRTWVGRDGGFSVGHQLGCSARSCAELKALHGGWPIAGVATSGSPDVCGETNIGWSCQSSPWADARTTCESVGARLCSSDELHNHAGARTGCGFDRSLCWAREACSGGHVAIVPGTIIGIFAGPPVCTSSAEVRGVRCCADVDRGRECGRMVETSVATGLSCWSSLPALVPDPHIISEASTDRSSQGEAYFADRFCPGWSIFVFASCDPVQEQCDGGIARLGNTIFDGGDDMYDVGNLITTSLMADCDTANDIHDCSLGSLRYHSDFERVPTNCFGSGGVYQMQQLEGMWVFFTTNTHDNSIDFTITGNLGSDDGSGSVTEYVFTAAPHTGFVKRECGDAHDPSVNHMIIVDSSQGTPTHTCNGGACTGSSSGLDDDTVAGIAPGSPLLYLLYSTEGGSCMKEDEHRAIFEVAALCILAADPFSALNRRQSADSQLLVEVDVDDQSHILFGGSALYVGWARGTPTKVSGPSSFVNALQFSGHEFLQLGDAGVDIEGNWTLDCWVFTDAALLAGKGEGVLAESLDKVAHVSMMSQQGGRTEVGSETVAGMWRSSGVDMAAGAEGWVRLSVSARRTVGEADIYSYFLGGELQASVQLETRTCGDALCPVNFFAIGGRGDGSAPFQLPVHRLRVFAGALAPSELDASGLPMGDLARYQPENSRSIMLSRGTDAIEVQWDTIGWNVAAHDHVHATLDSLGGIRLRCDNVSLLWDRAVGSGSGITGDLGVSNYTTSALDSDASIGLRVRYLDSDPCFDLWNGITCSLSDWPVGTQDCGEQLDCDALGWPASLHGSSTVCGASSLVGEFGSSDMCVREKTYSEAESLCTEMGGRLCTAAELEVDEGNPATCGYNSIFTWSWVSTPLDACPSTNQSLGMAGGAGSWFSFEPSALNSYYEIQLRSTHALDGDTFTMLGAFDAHAEIMSGQPATLHHRGDGAMLRWNATQKTHGAAFVHVSSLAPDAAYTMAAVLPPAYSWHTVSSHASYGSSVPLGVQKDGAVAVDLPFDFPFLGLEHSRMWVSSFGTILFEEPSSLGVPFGGVGNTHSAIMAAAGEFDLDHPQASVITSQPSPTELQVRWLAPMFGSEVFSDVSVVLAANGSATIRWDRVDLSGGGSLGHGLASLLEFDRAGTTQDTQAIGSGSISYTVDAPDEPVANLIQGAFYGAAPGQGLDFTGTFKYAVNLGGPGGMQIGDAQFTGSSTTQQFTIGFFDTASPGGMELDATPGLEITGAQQGSQSYSDAEVWGGGGGWWSSIGRSSNDIALEVIMNIGFGTHSSHGCLRFVLSGLQPGVQYSLQLLPANFRDDRAYDVRVNDVLLIDNFCPLAIAGGAHVGCFIRYTFESVGETCTIELDGGDVVSGGRIYPWLQALTLEELIEHVAPIRPALRLVDDAYLQLPSMTLGGAIAVSAWVKVGTLWDGEVGITLFNSFESDGCLDTDQCRNALDGTLDRGGWFAVGNDVNGKRPADLWTTNTIYDQGTGSLFWEGARDEWLMVTLSVSGRDVSVYAGDELRGGATLGTRLPRMMRHNNYVGAAHHAPFQQKAGGITMAIADFRLYDRSLSAIEVSALFADPATECCISAGLKDAYGVDDMDLSAHAMGSAVPSAVTIVPTERQASTHEGSNAQGCVSDTAATIRQLDMCGEITTVSDCSGVISDGTGPYANSLACGVRLNGYIGSTYTLTFDEFETQQGVDFLRVYNGLSSDAPLLAELSGKVTPAPIVSTSNTLYLQFTTNDNTPAVGFRVAFSCTGTLIEYWKPADVAIPLETAVISTLQADATTECLTDVLMSVQCCADATLPCANARVVSVGLSGQSPGLRGSIPDAMGRLGALRSLKLHDNFLTGTLPNELSQLHLLRDLQLSHNQFSMPEDRESLAALLGGMMHLKTLDIGMSDEEPSFEKTVVQPIPPLSCRVGDECVLTMTTRTSSGGQLPHGGVRMTVSKTDGSDSDCVCVDQMDGSYVCVFPPSWTSHQGVFDFALAHDGEEFVPLRTLVDPTSGVESTVNAYGRLGCLVPPIQCLQAHSFPNNDGAACVCEAGYYHNVYEGGWDCSHCVRGQEPYNQGTACRSCEFGKQSSSGAACVPCAPGQQPNLDTGADACIPCNSNSISVSGSSCQRCSIENGTVADDERTSCICPRGTYDSTVFRQNKVQCLGKHHRSAAVSEKTASQCVSCSELPCLDCESEIPKIREGWATAGTDDAPSTSSWLLFECPVSEACVNDGNDKCRAGHTGELCNVCQESYGFEDKKCEPCSVVNRSLVAYLVVFGVIVVIAGVLYARHNLRAESRSSETSLQVQLSTDNPLLGDTFASADTKRQSLSMTTVQRTDDAYTLFRVIWQPIRILVGYVQVVNQIGLVLDITFPPYIQSVFGALKLFAVNLKDLLHLDCWGNLSFYTQWNIRVFGVPLTLLGIVALHCMYVRRRGDETARKTAAGNLRSNAFFILFVVYPGVCNELFNIFNCRPLDSDHDVLLMDYEVDCRTTHHSIYEVVAYVMIGVFALGAPAGLGVLMLRRVQEYSGNSDSDRFVARRVADEQKISDLEAADAIRDVTTGREYSFLVNAFKPRYFYWEGVDMVRKLTLVGLLVVVGRGTVAQLFVAVCISCVSLMLQVHLAPYKHWEDNVFKCLVEAHIFLVVTIAPVLKDLRNLQGAEEETLGKEFYDLLLVGSFVAAILVGFVWTVFCKRRMIKEALAERAAAGSNYNESSAKATQRAIRLLHLGLTTNDDMRLLAAYFERLENMISKWSHVFISYRVAADRELARRLYDSLSALTIEETGQKLRVYLDQTRLEDGQRWDSGFMEGLSRSWVFLPIVSVGSVQPMMELDDGEDWCDNVLLEWTAALELHQRGTIKAVLPVLASQGDFFSDAQEAFGGLSGLPARVSAATIEQVVTHLQEITDDGSTAGLRELVQQASGQPEPTIQGVVNSLLKFQGIKVTASGAGTEHSHGHLSVGMDDLTDCVDRVHATVSVCLKRIGVEDSSDEAGQASSPPSGSKMSALSRLGSRLSVGGGSGEVERDERLMGVQFGEGGSGSAGSGLYLSAN